MVHAAVVTIVFVEVILAVVHAQQRCQDSACWCEPTLHSPASSRLSLCTFALLPAVWVCFFRCWVCSSFFFSSHAFVEIVRVVVRITESALLRALADGCSPSLSGRACRRARCACARAVRGAPLLQSVFFFVHVPGVDGYSPTRSGRGSQSLRRVLRFIPYLCVRCTGAACSVHSYASPGSPPNWSICHESVYRKRRSAPCVWVCSARCPAIVHCGPCHASSSCPLLPARSHFGHWAAAPPKLGSK